MRRLSPLVLLLAVAAACGGSSKPAAPTTIDGFHVAKVFTVHETDSSLEPKTITIDRFGYYGIEAVNDGKAVHALELKGHGVDRRTGKIAPGKSAEFAVNFERSGNYVLFSPFDDDPGRGLTATVTVR